LFRKSFISSPIPSNQLTRTAYPQRETNRDTSSEVRIFDIAVSWSLNRKHRHGLSQKPESIRIQ
jgi:hypothetical protein